MEINWRSIAEMAYEKHAEYIKEAAGLTCEIKPWTKLEVSERLAWLTAVKTACEVFGRAVTA